MTYESTFIRLDAWFNKGDANMKMGNTSKALATFGRALKIEPKDEESWYMKARCLCSIGKEEEAIDALLVATSLAPIYKNKIHKEHDFHNLYKLSRFKRLSKR